MSFNAAIGCIVGLALLAGIVGFFPDPQAFLENVRHTPCYTSFFPKDTGKSKVK